MRLVESFETCLLEDTQRVLALPRGKWHLTATARLHGGGRQSVAPVRSAGVEQLRATALHRLGHRRMGAHTSPALRRSARFSAVLLVRCRPGRTCGSRAQPYGQFVLSRSSSSAEKAGSEASCAHCLSEPMARYT